MVTENEKKTEKIKENLDFFAFFLSSFMLCLNLYRSLSLSLSLSYFVYFLFFFSFSGSFFLSLIWIVFIIGEG